MRYHHFETDGFVSIFVGSFPSQEAWASNVRERYGADRAEDEPLAEWMGEFGFQWFDHDFMDTNNHGMSIGPLRDLLAPCSYSASYLEAAMQAAAQVGVRETQCVILLHDFRYDPSVTGVTRGKYLRFLGAFPYSAVPG